MRIPFDEPRRTVFEQAIREACADPSAAPWLDKLCLVDLDDPSSFGKVSKASFPVIGISHQGTDQVLGSVGGDLPLDAVLILEEEEVARDLSLAVRLLCLEPNLDFSRWVGDAVLLERELVSYEEKTKFLSELAQTPLEGVLVKANLKTFLIGLDEVLINGLRYRKDQEQKITARVILNSERAAFSVRSPTHFESRRFMRHLFGAEQISRSTALDASLGMGLRYVFERFSHLLSRTVIEDKQSWTEIMAQFAIKETPKFRKKSPRAAVSWQQGEP